jgi:predicted nucleic-acid-binding protein
MSSEAVFVDTNLFLRFLTNDVPAQADAVERLLRQAMRGEITLVTSSLVIAEIVWTLETYYNLPRDEVQEKVLAILNTNGLNIEDIDLLLQAILWYADKGVDFIDAYNAAWLLDQGIRTAYTLDRKHFARFEGITVKAPGET